MRVGGLIKTTALDFPGLVAAVVFVQGCNFTCPYCHNPHLVRPQEPPLPPAEVEGFLAKRRKYLDGVVVSGGEPTLQPGLAGFCRQLRELGYKVKLDTNGGRPAVLAALLAENLLDYVAMDLKTDPAHYPAELAPAGSGESVLASIALLQASGVPHEWRFTAAPPLATPAAVEGLARAAAGEAPLYIQQYRPGRVLNPAYMAGREPLSQAGLESLAAVARPYLPVFIR